MLKKKFTLLNEKKISIIVKFCFFKLSDFIFSKIFVFKIVMLY